MNTEYLTTEQAGEQRGVTDNTIRNWIRFGVKNEEGEVIKLSAKKKNAKHWMVHPDDLKNFCDSLNMI